VADFREVREGLRGGRGGAFDFAPLASDILGLGGGARFISGVVVFEYGLRTSNTRWVGVREKSKLPFSFVARDLGV